MKRNATFYVNEVKYLLFWVFSPIFSYFCIIIDIFYFLIAFGIFAPGMGENVKKNFFCNFSIQKIPISGGFSSFLRIFFQLFCPFLFIFIFSIFPYFNAILLHRTIFCHSYMYFMFFRWLILYI